MMNIKSEFIIRNVDFASDVDKVKSIFIEYQQYLGLDLCFQNFENELNTLNLMYALPKGNILLAENEFGEILGCIALKPIGDNACEMKRLFVKQNARGLGIGEKLVNAIIIFAKNAGYSTLKLDTLSTLTEAISLYRKFGFEETEAYVFNPLNEVMYFKLNL